MQAIEQNDPEKLSPEYLNQARTNYAITNERIASGARFLGLSDDVSAGTRVLRIREDMAKTQNYYDTVKSVNDELSVTENAITSINTILSNVHTKIVKGLSDAAGTSGREALTNEIDNLKASFCNTPTQNITTSTSSAVPASAAPFTVKDGKLLYNGIDVSGHEKRNDGQISIRKQRRQYSRRSNGRRSLCRYRPWTYVQKRCE